ncbi:MAG: hypothetical protein CMO82_11865 [Winogradskyella sp.]|nr:hypothetical protein [Winogradskyella sp.]|tara:strand:- start:1616 stop:2488 length:873 start_codon:yes stop_codon:yes gene_type:complete
MSINNIETPSLNFSVVIPLYNKEKYIERTLKSVLEQSYTNFEVIIINDGSTDNSLNVVKNIKDKRLRVISQPNSGVSNARNKGIELASYNWVALLDGDDKWEPNFLYEIALVITNIQDCAIYASGYKKINLKGDVSYSKSKYLPKDKGYVGNYFKALYYNGPVYTSSSVCLNKDVLKNSNQTPLFPSNVKRGEDLDAWTRVALQNQLYYINKPLVIIAAVLESSTYKHKYDYKDSFEYFKWLSYECKNKNERKYLKLYVYKKKIKIIKKLLVQRQYKIALKVLVELLIKT